MRVRSAEAGMVTVSVALTALLALTMACAGGGAPSPTTPSAAPALDAGAPDAPAAAENGPCVELPDNPYLPGITATHFQQVDSAMQRVVDLAGEGNAGAATAVFLHEVHGFTHVVDPPLRESDAALATALFQTVYDLEVAIASGVGAAEMVPLAEAVQTRLAEAAVELGCAG